MERIISRGNIVTRNAFLITVSLFYVAAMTAPAWGLGWGTPVLAPWSAALAMLVLAGGWRYLQPGHSYPKTDLSFIIPVIISINLFSLLLGAGGEWVRPMNFLLVALCALYYSIMFNIAVAGIIFLLELANVMFAPGPAGAETSVNLAVYGAYLGGIPLVLGRLLRSEYKKKERALRAYKQLTEGAESLNPEDAEFESIKSLKVPARAAGNINAMTILYRSIGSLLDAALSAIPAGNALMFMPDSDGESVSLRVFKGSEAIREGHVVRNGHGIIGWVVKEKKPVLVHDRATGLDYMEDEGSVRSFLAVPVLDDGHLKGILALDSRKSEAFSEKDKAALERFAAVALNMLQNTRRYRTVGDNASKFQKLHQVSSEISSSLDLDTILDRLSVMISDIVPYDYLTISFLEAEYTASFKVAKGYGDLPVPKDPVPLENTYLGWIVTNMRKMPLNDFNGRAEKIPIFPVKELQAGLRSFLGVPLITEGRVLGVITVGFKRPGGVSAYEQDMLGIVADQVAVNIANARLHETITLMATTDGLTGLINHRTFQEKADERFTRAARFPEDISLLLFDIDHFKKVNDTFGHPIGDAVLKKVGAIIRETARTIDVAARYGGEEFAVLMENTGESGAMKMAERIRSTIQKTKFLFEDKTVPVTVSIGCASYPSHCANKKELIEHADKSLYWAKNNGRNRCCAFSSIMESLTPERKNI